MTIKEIALLCGVKVKTIYRWAEQVKFLNDKMSLRKKIDDGSPENPADFTLEETLAIIGDGSNNRALEALLREHAANRTALAVRDAAPSDRQGQIEAVFGALMEQYRRLEERVEAQSAQLALLPAILERLGERKPTLVELRARELKRFLEDNVQVTGNKNDKVVTYFLYNLYSSKVAEEVRYSRNAFPHVALGMLPGATGLKIRGYNTELRGVIENRASQYD